MTATLAPSPWPAPTAPRLAAGWRFARELVQPAGWLFELRRNVSLTPRQLMLAYALLCTLSLTVAAAFWLQGIAMVVAFTGLELIGVGIALVVVARHAGDREVITLSGRELAVEQHVGVGVARTLFRAEWVRVEPAAEDGSLVELSGQGRRVRVGRHVRPELRVALAEELRRALRLQRVAGEQVVDHEPKP
ncbi:MAG: DUF2244 domain-containing protein [Burkholderiales bacterium]|nr:DUF2244 domain-containing protein [Burkholderiales bacterium]